MIFKWGNSIKKADYHKTKIACYMGFITQAIAANFAPLLFLKFHSDYHISLGTESISYLIYKNGMDGGQFGFQSANAVIFFIVIVAISLFQMTVMNKKEEQL